ncbi:MAG: cyclic peptide export ABC transporter [Phaeodactylibacter sp.]|nr:cyclic peptide export ABC transporter [Phaeodactylibacter sp.]MCB0615931.1 cyclic peptide export ABC transporter [Phaeodactylibacter sp.]
MPTLPYPVVAFGILSGISNSFLIAVINSAAESVANDKMSWRYLVMYALCLCLFFYSKRYILDRSVEIVGAIINRVRHRLADMVRFTELPTLEKYGTSSIYARISQDATTISNVSTIIINGVQQSIMIVFTLLYIAAISPWSFGLVAVGMAIGLFFYVGRANAFRKMWHEVSQKETEFYDKLGHILQGFKEIRVNRRKNEDVFESYVEVNDQIRDYRIKTNKLYNIVLIFLEIFIYVLLGLILFALPHLHSEHSEVVIKVVAAILFTIGPLEGIIFSVPVVGDANNCARNVMELEAQLKEELKKMDEQQIDNHSPSAYQALPFESEIVIKGLSYQYPRNNGYGAGFQVGPLDLTIRKGELIFVTGGNGSGKSTFLKLLTGLYKPNGGHIQLDGDGEEGRRISLHTYQQYQNLFSIIFSDYHLFDKIYGIKREIDPAEVNALLKSLGMPEEKTTYKDGAFTSIHLSSGQKKRLALATVMLEDKPIYVFDEVAADLDPDFRDKFYFEILQEMKARNKTILVVTHDQQYWNACDRLIQFQDGMVRELSKQEVRTLVEMAVMEEGR